MGRASATVSVPGRAADAEALWYDPVRWAAWVDGFGHVVTREGDWPRVGARLVWQSPPAGRGRVEERVVEPQRARLVGRAGHDRRGRHPAHGVPSSRRMTWICLLYTSPSPRDLSTSRMPSSA